MSTPPPVVYLFHGEDEFGIAQSVSDLEARLGDASTASMNTARLDGRSASFDELYLAANALPFLGSRRLVIVHHPLARVTTPAQREKFLGLLEGLPPTTALVLLEYRTLGKKEKRDSKEQKEHWLLAWAKEAGSRAYVRSFSIEAGGAMTRWILNQAKQAGGKFTPQAAESLSSLVGDDTRLAYQEIQKLLSYTNGDRPVEPEDVDQLTAVESKLEDFALPNALRELDGRKAMAVVHRLLEEQDPIMILHGMVNQVRVLLLARDILDRGGQVNEVVAELARFPSLKIKPYPARLAGEQARRMDRAELEAIYRRLLEIDEAIKTSQLDGDLALDLFVAAFTTQ